MDPLPLELVAERICWPLTKTLTVLVIPNIPPGSTTLPTKNDKL
jgi:hypothetical protein